MTNITVAQHIIWKISTGAHGYIVEIIMSPSHRLTSVSACVKYIRFWGSPAVYGIVIGNHWWQGVMGVHVNAWCKTEVAGVNKKFNQAPRSLGARAAWLDSTLDWITTLNWLGSSAFQGWDDWYLLRLWPIDVLQIISVMNRLLSACRPVSSHGVRNHDPSWGNQRWRARFALKGGRCHPNLSRSQYDYLWGRRFHYTTNRDSLGVVG